MNVMAASGAHVRRMCIREIERSCSFSEDGRTAGVADPTAGAFRGITLTEVNPTSVEARVRSPYRPLQCRRQGPRERSGGGGRHVRVYLARVARSAVPKRIR